MAGNLPSSGLCFGRRTFDVGLRHRSIDHESKVKLKSIQTLNCGRKVSADGKEQGVEEY